MLLLLIFIFIELEGQRPISCQEEPAELDNVNCQLHPEVVPTDNASYFRYFPYYVKLHRCRGSVIGYDPGVRACVAIKTKPVFALVTEVSVEQGTVIELTNHTECAGVCVQEPNACSDLELWSNETCSCKCKFDTAPAISPCCSPKVWSQNRCTCRCPTDPRQCVSRKVWSGDSCSCVCKSEIYKDCLREDRTIDEGTCLCIARPATGRVFSPGGVSVATLVVALVCEALLLIFVYLFCYQFCFKRHLRPRYEALRKGRLRHGAMLARRKQNDMH